MIHIIYKLQHFNKISKYYRAYRMNSLYALFHIKPTLSKTDAMPHKILLIINSNVLPTVLSSPLFFSHNKLPHSRKCIVRDTHNIGAEPREKREDENLLFHLGNEQEIYHYLLTFMPEFHLLLYCYNICKSTH